MATKTDGRAHLEDRTAQLGLAETFRAFPESVRRAAERANKPMQLPADWTPTTEPAGIFVPIVAVRE